MSPCESSAPLLDWDETWRCSEELRRHQTQFLACFVADARRRPREAHGYLSLTPRANRSRTSTAFSGIDSRADNSIIRYNYVQDADGAGVRLGGHEVDGYEYGVNNQVSEMRDLRFSIFHRPSSLGDIPVPKTVV